MNNIQKNFFIGFGNPIGSASVASEYARFSQSIGFSCPGEYQLIVALSQLGSRPSRPFERHNWHPGVVFIRNYDPYVIVISQ